MTFLNPGALILLVLLPMLAALFVWRDKQRQAKLRQLGENHLIEQLVSVNPSIRRWKMILWLAALTLWIIALARPVWGESIELIETEGLSIMVLLDVSRSMDARDVSPSRLERAKLDLRDLLPLLRGHEVGLMLFAGTAFPYFPPTNDIETALTFLNSVSTRAITQQGTDIHLALQTAIQQYQRRENVRLIFLIVSDGEAVQGDTLSAINEAAQSGIIIHTIGYGTLEGDLIPLYDEIGNLAAYQSDEGGNLVQSRLEEELLKTIASLSGGSYRRADASAMGLLANEILAVDANTLNTQAITRQVERFGIFLAMAFAALSLEMLLTETTKKKTV